MKAKISIIISLVFVFVVTELNGQDKLKETEVKSALTEIFDISNNQNYKLAARKFLFDENEIRPYNFENRAEAKTVKRMAKKIKAYLDLSDSYEYESIVFTEYKNMPSAELKVNFKSGDQDLTISFYFVDKNGAILLYRFK